MIPRYGHPPKHTRRYVRRPGVYAILPMSRGVLVTHQAAPFHEFQLPGGGIDPGEHPLQALHREVLEETGWRICRARHFGVFRKFTFMPEYDLWAEKICTVFVAHPTRRQGPPREAGHSDHVLDRKAALKTLAKAGDRALLARAIMMNLVR